MLRLPFLLVLCSLSVLPALGGETEPSPTRLSRLSPVPPAQLRDSLGMTEKDFQAIEPLLTGICALHLQKSFFDFPSFVVTALGDVKKRLPPEHYARAVGIMAEQYSEFPVLLEMDEMRKASLALHGLLKDIQANDTEIQVAMNRVRKARQAYTAALVKIQTDLASVLNQRQATILVMNRFLD
jgi:hypothetical protein